MDQHLKQRLVGISVIFALAIIFVPMILDGSGQRPKSVDIEIPEAPHVEARVDVRQKVIELKREVEQIPLKQPLIIDRTSEAQANQEPANQEPASEEQAQDDTDQQAAADTEVAGKTSTAAPEKLVAKATEDKGDKEAKKEAEKKVEKKAAKPVAKTEQKTVEKPKPVKQASTAKPAPATSKPRVGGDSWVIQIGSFQDKEKAFKQRDRIRKSRLAAVFIEQYRHNGSLRYRVRMGPFIKKDKAQVVRNKVLAKYNIKGLVMRHEQ